MHDAIAEGGRTDFAAFRLVDEEMAISAGAVGTGLQLSLQRQQAIRQLKLKRGGCQPASFAARRFAVC